MTMNILTLPPSALPGYEACLRDVLALLDRVAPQPAIVHVPTLRLVLEDRAALLPGLGARMPEPAEAAHDGLADAVADALAAAVHVTTPPAVDAAALDRKRERQPGDLRAWTPERVELLKRDRRPGVDQQDMLRRINELPGREIPNLEAVRMKGKALGLPAISGRGVLIRDAETGEIRPQGMVFTPERIAYMREHYPTAETVADVLAGINALPGPPCRSEKSLSIRAAQAGLRRPPTTRTTLENRRASMARAQAARIEQAEAAPTLKPALTVAPEPPRAIPPSDWASPGVLTPAAERDAREQITAGVGARQLFEDFGGPSLDWWQAMCDLHRRGRAA